MLASHGTAAEVSTAVRAAVGEAFTTANAEHQRDPHRLSMSKLGGCTRQAAYMVAGTEVSDVPLAEEGRAANLGTWQHAGLLPLLAKHLPDARYETPVVLSAAGLTIGGQVDLDWADVVMDLKTVGERRLHGVRRSGAFADHRAQVMGYVLARVQMGIPTRWAVWTYLDRASGDVEVVVEPFTNAAMLAVIDRVEEIVRWAETPDQAPRDNRGPGLSFACDRCPWLRRCWGEDATPGQTGAQRLLARDEPGKAAMAALYDDASARVSAGKLDQEFAKLVLDGTRPGIYGPWAVRRGKSGGTHLDEAQVRADYAARGEEPPTRQSSARLLIKLVEALQATTYGRKELKTLREATDVAA